MRATVPCVNSSSTVAEEGSTLSTDCETDLIESVPLDWESFSTSSASSWMTRVRSSRPLGGRRGMQPMAMLEASRVVELFESLLRRDEMSRRSEMKMRTVAWSDGA